MLSPPEIAFFMWWPCSISLVMSYVALNLSNEHNIDSCLNIETWDGNTISVPARLPACLPAVLPSPNTSCEQNTKVDNCVCLLLVSAA